MVWILLAGLGAALLAVLIVSYRFSSMVVRPDVRSYDAGLQEEIRRGGIDPDRYAQYRMEEFTLPSAFGCLLHGIILYKKDGASFPDGRERVAVFAHGYTDTLFGCFKYADILRENGFQCVLFDERNHGKSSKRPTTMGAHEALDVAAVCAFARERFGQDCVLGTYGESMGAATVMLHAPTDDNLAFVIEDCGYSDLIDELASCLKTTYHLPKYPFTPAASLLSWLRGGVRFSTVRPAAAVAACPESLPMLFIHGMDDTFVPADMVLVNYAAKRGKRAIHRFPDAAHAQSCYNHPAEYRRVVTAFLADYGIIPPESGKGGQ